MCSVSRLGVFATIVAATLSIHPKSVHLELETRINIEPKDRNNTYEIIGNVHKFINKIKGAFNKKNLSLRTREPKTYLTDFIKNVTKVLLKLDDTSFERFFVKLCDVMSDYIRYEGSAFSDIVKNPIVRKYVHEKLQKWSKTDPLDMKKEVAEYVANKHDNGYFENLIDFVNEFYDESDVEKMNKFTGQLKNSTKKHEFEDVIVNGLHVIFFQHYDKLNYTLRTKISDEIDTLHELMTQTQIKSGEKVFRTNDNLTNAQDTPLKNVISKQDVNNASIIEKNIFEKSQANESVTTTTTDDKTNKTVKKFILKKDFSGPPPTKEIKLRDGEAKELSMNTTNENKLAKKIISKKEKIDGPSTSNGIKLWRGQANELSMNTTEKEQVVKKFIFKKEKIGGPSTSKDIKYWKGLTTKLSMKTTVPIPNKTTKRPLQRFIFKTDFVSSPPTSKNIKFWQGQANQLAQLEKKNFYAKKFKLKQDFIAGRISKTIDPEKILRSNKNMTDKTSISTVTDKNNKLGKDLTSITTSVSQDITNVTSKTISVTNATHGTTQIIPRVVSSTMKRSFIRHYKRYSPLPKTHNGSNTGLHVIDFNNIRGHLSSVPQNIPQHPNNASEVTYGLKVIEVTRGLPVIGVREFENYLIEVAKNMSSNYTILRSGDGKLKVEKVKKETTDVPNVVTTTIQYDPLHPYLINREKYYVPAKARLSFTSDRTMSDIEDRLYRMNIDG